MSPQQISANTQSSDHPVAATLLPSPGRWARAVFRCVLFASVTVFAAIVLGMLERATFWVTRRTLVSDAILFGIILASLLFQRRGKVGRADDSDVGLPPRA